MKYLLVIIPLFFIGCVSKQGISFKYYPQCEENYDMYGVYYKKCKEDIKFHKKRKPPLCLQCN
ncbi:hypothetical protein C6V80_02300 [Caminibacter pacificus]|uniref:Lipoprotein n=1 Tax=Caminibacter pacificus TaxID=1424653 RepID=A0ABX5THD6_9BACT|nr:hypothetical protein C6V80_02300 [Caminibacter pacificus]